MVLPFFAVLVALLMVSRIPYPHVVNQVFRGERTFAHAVARDLRHRGDHGDSQLFGADHLLPVCLLRPGAVVLARRSSSTAGRKSRCFERREDGRR